MSRLFSPGLAVGAILLSLSGAAAANSPPAMIVPGQMNVGATGAFTYTIPIAVPPGTAGMAPALSLDYSSQSGDGLVGLGWTLSGLPAISRCPKTLAQDGVHGAVNYDSNDRFCLEGQRLVAISGTYGADGTEYRTEIDGFSKIVSYGVSGNGPAYFKVWTKSGQIMEFGNTTDSRITTVIVTPTTGETYGVTGTARAWAVDKISDTKGNYLTVTYTNDGTNGQAYPTRVDYTGNASASLSTYNSVRFTYTGRSDAVPTYQAGALQTTTMLLAHVKTYQGSNVVSDYQLGYQAGSLTNHSLLTSIRLCDGSGACLAPTTLGWQGGPTSLSYSETALSVPHNQVTKWPAKVPSDYSGDGVTDATFQVNHCNDGTSVYLGQPDGTFTNANATLTSSPNGCGTSASFFINNTLLLDYDGDGRPDVFLQNSSNGFLFHNDGPPLSGWPAHFAQQTFNSDRIADVGDYDGDGLTDLLYHASSSYSPYYSAGTGTFSLGSTIPHSDKAVFAGDFDGDGCTNFLMQGNGADYLENLCNSTASDIGVRRWSGQEVFGDFNGDGMTDILDNFGSNATLWLSTGRGFIEYQLGAIGGGDYIMVAGDFNGDGKTDVAAIAPHQSGLLYHRIYLSTGTGFVEAVDIPLPAGQTYDRGVAGDWNSDGADEIWLQNPTSDTIVALTAAASGTAFAPVLMNSVSNGVGSTITVTYDRINKNGTFYARATNATYPTQDVDGPLYLVRRIDSGNGLGACTPLNMTNCYSSTYSYAGAKADLKGRGFLGFGTVTITDPQTGVVQATNYNTAFPVTGTIASQTKTHGGTALSSVTNSYGQTVEGTGTDGVAYFFVSLTQSVTTGNDLDGTQLPCTTTDYTYDGYGNALTVNTSTKTGPTGQPCQTTVSSKNTTNTYSNDATNWLLGRLLTGSVQSIVGSSNLTRNSAFAYDAASGLLTQETVEPSNTANLYPYVGNDPTDNTDPTGEDCVSKDGTTTCDILKTGSRIPEKVSFATPGGVSGTQSSSAFSEHNYDIETTHNKSDKSVQQSIVNDPTPGNDKPATPQGTPNDARPGGMRGALAGLSGALFGDKASSPVKSYSFTYKGNKWTLNVTQPGHGLHFGYVLRGSIDHHAMSIGEGWALKQIIPMLGPYVDDVWYEQNQRNIDEAK